MRGIRALALIIVAGTLLATVSACASPGASGEFEPPGARLTPGPTPAARPGASVVVVGMPSLIVRSTDGGARWEQVHRSPNGWMEAESLPVLWSVVVASERDGWAVGAAGVFASGDGGGSWRAVASPPDVDPNAVAAVGPDHVWVVGDLKDPGGQQPFELTAAVLASSDGGATWRRQRVPPLASLTDVVFADARHGWALGGEGPDYESVVLVTDDGGAHWRRRRTPPGRRLSAIACVDRRHLWISAGQSNADPQKAHASSILATADGGGTWKEQYAAPSGSLTDVCFVDGDHGWVVGIHGTILHTTDGGATWRPQQAPPNAQGLSAVSFSDAEHGWIVAEKTALLATSDGGSTWTVVKPLGGHDMLTDVVAFGP